MELKILGFHSAIPTVNSHPTSQYLNIKETGILIDCGEATQVQLRKAKIKFNSIAQIFISHLHGDHIFGLIGFISSLSLLGRTNPLYIFGPKGIKNFIEIQIKATNSYYDFKLIFIELESKNSELIFENEKYLVKTIPLKHRIYTNGFLFIKKKELKKLNIEEIKKYPEIQICDYNNIKKGNDFVLSDGYIIKNEYLTFDSNKEKKYAYCSDTIYNPEIIPIIKEADLLYHEATFLNDLKDLAIRTGHSTALEAGLIAKESQVKKLIIGHFSNRYSDYTTLQNQAKEHFDNTFLPKELESIFI